MPAAADYPTSGLEGGDERSVCLGDVLQPLGHGPRRDAELVAVEVDQLPRVNGVRRKLATQMAERIGRIPLEAVGPADHLQGPQHRAYG